LIPPDALTHFANTSASQLTFALGPMVGSGLALARFDNHNLLWRIWVNKFAKTRQRNKNMSELHVYDLGSETAELN